MSTPTPTPAKVEPNLIANDDFSKNRFTKSGREGGWRILVSAIEGEGLGKWSPFKKEFNVRMHTIEVDLASLKEAKVAQQVQLIQYVDPLEAGATYKLSFEAKADKDGSAITTSAGVGRDGLGWQKENLTHEFKTYEYTFTYTGKPVPGQKPVDPKKFSRVELRIRGDGIVYIRKPRLVQTRK